MKPRASRVSFVCLFVCLFFYTARPNLRIQASATQASDSLVEILIHFNLVSKETVNLGVNI